MGRTFICVSTNQNTKFSLLKTGLKYAPPKKGELQWEDKRSAKELAQAWCRKGFACPPADMRLLLERAFRTEIVFDEAKPECVIRLDDFAGEHRNCDLVLLCNVGTKRMAINIEAKADEPFGDVIGEYYDRKIGSGSKVPARIRQLSQALLYRGRKVAHRMCARRTVCWAFTSPWKRDSDRAQLASQTDRQVSRSSIFCRAPQRCERLCLRHSCRAMLPVA